LRHSWIHCRGSLVDALVQRSGLAAATAVAPGSAATCDRALEALRCELAGPRPDEDVAAGILQTWLLALVRNQRPAQPAAMPEPYASIRAEIEAGFTQRLHLDGLAARAGVSVQHFGRTYRALFGESPIACQLRLRLEHATWLLRDIERGVGAVAAEIGYGDLYQFSRAFARRYGCSPRRWRQRLLAGEE
jgi:transcriptional regulator GlxA family with amidase domain